MICKRPAPTAIKAAGTRRSPLSRIELAPPRPNQPCAYQAEAEYQAARLGKLLRNQPSLEQAHMAGILLNELIDAYRQAIICARQDRAIQG